MFEETTYYVLNEESPDQDARGEFFEVVSSEIGTPAFDEMCIVRADPEADGATEEDLAKAKRIVLALNCHTDLVSALAGLIGLVQLIIPTLDGSQRIGVEQNHRLTVALAVLARVGGGS